MTLQNRVTPFGEVVAITQRGLFTGNRGIIHDPATKSLLNRRWATKTWITCACDFNGLRRTPMAGRSWTELFFFDEAVALAAGHRPCFLCRRPAAQAFQAAWAAGADRPPPSARQMDETLHAQRLDGRRKRLHPIIGAPKTLPDGAMVAAGGLAYVTAADRVYSWSPSGYRWAPSPPAFEALLTPPATMAALRAGYRPVLHPSIAP